MLPGKISTRWGLRTAAVLAAAAIVLCAPARAADDGLRDGLAAFLRGEYEQAIVLLDKAVASPDAQAGPERTSALRVLATAQLLAGRYAKAEAAATELLAAGLLSGQVEAATASDLLLLARIEKEQGRYERAEGAYREGMERLGRLYGVDHPEVSDALRSLGDIRFAQGRLVEAERLYWRAHMVGSYVAGGDSSLVGAALLGLGRVRLAQHRKDEARVLLLRALQIADKPPRADNKWGRLDARDLRALHAEAPEHIAFRGRIYTRAAEPSHPDFAEFLEHRGAILRALDRLDEADASFKRALEIRRKAFGDDHPMAAYDRRQLAEIALARR